MKVRWFLVFSVFLPLCSAFADEKTGGFVGDLVLNQLLVVKLYCGDVRIVPSGSVSRVSVRWTATARDEHPLSDVQGQLKSKDGKSILTFAVPKGAVLRVEIGVPSGTDLVVRLGVGDILVGEVAGNKDLRTRVGDIDLAVNDTASYRNIDAKSTIGDVERLPLEGGIVRGQSNCRYLAKVRTTIGDVKIHSSTIGETIPKASSVTTHGMSSLPGNTSLF